MFCLKCGKEIKDDAKFCPHCGAVTSAAPGSQGASSGAPVYTMPDSNNGAAQWSSAPQGGNKRRGTGLLIGGAVAAVLVIVVIVAAVGGLFSSPKGQVEKALAQTTAAYAGAMEKLGASELEKLIQDRSYTQRVSFELNSINEQLTGWYDLSSLKGIGIRMNADYDQKGRKMDFDMAAFWDDEDLASIQMLVDGGRMTFSSPEFTKGDAYGFSTETLGADLDKLGADGGDVDLKKIGFNLFDLMEKATPPAEQTKEMKDAVADANKQLFDAVEVEKSGKKSIEVNGKNMDATLYNVVIPEDAMKDYVNALEDVMKMVDTEDMMKDILQSMGFDKSTVNEILSDMGSTDVYGELAAILKQGVKELGDLELEVYVSGGYVCAVSFDYRASGTKVEIELFLGGGDNYVDDLSLEISAGGEKLTIESNGDHSAKSGVFTDETTIRLGSDRVTSELRWEPKASNGNFEWELGISNAASLQMEGQLTTTKNSVDLQLDNLSVKAAGTKLISLSAGYYLGPCEGMKVSHSSPKLLSDMDEDDLEDLVYDLQDNAEDWAYGLQDRIPSDLLYYLY